MLPECWQWLRGPAAALPPALPRREGRGPSLLAVRLSEMFPQLFGRRGPAGAEVSKLLLYFSSRRSTLTAGSAHPPS